MIKSNNWNLILSKSSFISWMKHASIFIFHAGNFKISSPLMEIETRKNLLCIFKEVDLLWECRKEVFSCTFMVFFSSLKLFKTHDATSFAISGSNLRAKFCSRAFETLFARDWKTCLLKVLSKLTQIRIVWVGRKSIRSVCICLNIWWVISS